MEKKPPSRTALTFGLCVVAALSLVAVATESSRSEIATAVGAVCFTLAIGFLAISEAISRRG